MNNLSKLFFGFSAAAMMFSCSSDEPANNAGGNNDGDAVYMNIRIKDANSSSFGKGSDGGYEYGDANEHKIADARFFFYDGNGNFLVEAGINDLGGNNGTTGNVEYISESAIVLQGLKEDELPEYMITVLNAPASFTPGVTMEQTASKVSALTDEAGNFVMSTSSFFGGDTKNYSDTYYYANRLQASDFHKTKEDAVAGDNPVEVYVERLAAKFSVSGIDEGYNEVKVTVAGNVNGDIEDGDFSGPQAGTKLYVKFDKWGVSHTEKASYMSKNLTADKAFWSFGANNTTIAGWDWNNAGDFRSHWGASCSYGNANPDLNVLTYATCEASVTQPVYAAETTNTKDNVSINGTVNINNVTCVLLTATVYTKDENGAYNPLDLVLYRGIYYTEEQFKMYLLQIVNNKTPLNYYICENPDAPSTETKKYHQVSADDVVLYHPQGSTTASVEVKFAADDATLYAQAIVDGKESYSVIDGGVDKLNGDLKSFFGNGNVQNTAIGYKGGKMFYTVPVEHLLKKSAEAVAYAVENEANYGTVRNHWYKINVNSVAKLGHGIFVPGEGEEPGEPLIPENPNDDRFNLGAQINVLSWKVVNQNVDL